uniref:Fungal lipase-like domain-containing protein n=1 Tax=Acrobeloides nanus TaxID=290746 RepID=A0A914CRV3_9BILA
MASAAYSGSPELCVHDNFDNSTVTGHSLGASLATLAAGYIAALQYYPANQIKLVTFGQPRTGDLGYANYIDNTVWYNNDMTVSNWYTECDENESNKCSDQFEKNGIFGYDILDHLSYFNKLADYATFGCPRH